MSLNLMKTKLIKQDSINTIKKNISVLEIYSKT